MKILCFEINYIGFDPLERRAIEFIKQRQCIEAIKLIKFEKNIGLAEAKKVFDKILIKNKLTQYWNGEVNT